jgi:hypothetical protein
LAESRANPTSCPARLLERIAPLHARSGGVKAGGVQTAAAESYRLYLPHWNRFRKPPPDRAAEKGSVAEHFPMRKFPATRRLRGGRAVAAAQSCGCGGSLGARASGSGLGWFTEGFDTLDLKEAKALLDELAT